MTMTPLKLLAASMAVAVAILTGAGGGWSDPVAAAPVPKVSVPENPLITPDTRKAIDAGLEYLAKNQAEDGSWVTGDYRGTVAGTALAGRAFLAAGYQPGQGPNGARLAKAIEYVLKSEDGGVLAQGKAAPMEEHGFAVHFLADAYGKVTDKALKERMKATLTRAVKVIADGQNREGGWRYQPNSKDADISVTCCQLHALAAAKRAGFEVPQTTIDNGVKYILSCRDLEQSGKFRYTPKVQSGSTAASASFAHTAAAISALKAVAFKGEKEVLEDGTEFIRSFKPGISDLLFYDGRYYVAPVVSATGGKNWEAWFSAVRDELLDRRNKNGVWDDHSKSSSHFNTALALIILQATKYGGTALAGAPPFEVSLAPATLTQTQSSAIDVMCTVSNTSGKPITLLWDVPRVKLAKDSVHVFTDGWGGKEQKRLELATGESRRLSVSVSTGEMIPVLDVGVYRVVVEVTIAEEIPGRHVTGTARLSATEKREGEPLTAASVVAIARGYCERTNSLKLQRIDYDSYFIRRHGSDWDVEFPAGNGSVTVSVNPTNKKAFIRPVP